MEDEQLRAEVQRLRERVKTLENEQSEPDSGALTPTRRRLLGGAAGGTLGFAALLSAPSPAAAASGQVGSPSNRLDFYGDTVDTNTLEADRIDIGDSGTIDHGSVSAGSTSYVTVSYSTAFASNPAVLQTAGATGGPSAEDPQSLARNQDTSGFESGIYNRGSTTRTFDSVGWMAVEQ